MAKKSKDIKPGYGKLLDAWSPPRNAGHSVGCIATSFTFSTAFFEEECLARFLGVKSDPLEDGPAYIIEREEKMAQIICACAIVDQHHCKGLRSLRWDLLPARVARGILHAKVSLLVWTDAVRLIVGSANLTEDGYRRNLEIYATFDYAQSSECPITLLRSYTQFLGECANYSQRDDHPPSTALLRVHALLDRVAQTPANWGLQDDDARRTGRSAYPVPVRPGGANVFSSLNTLWPATSPASDAYVVSPFFDPPEAPNVPAKDLWQLLRKRGDAHVHLCLDAEDTPDGEVLVRAPRTLLDAQPGGRPGIETIVCRLRQDATRPLHAKAISLEDDRWRLYMVGSSNFTSAGLGLPMPRNVEANVAFLVDSSKLPDAAKSLDLAFPENEQVPLDKVRWQGGFVSEDEVTGAEPVLLDTFGSATLTADVAGKLVITFYFAGTPPKGWRIVSEDESAEVFSEDDWKAAGAPEIHTVPWELPRPPSGFWVSWRNSDGRAWWPVNVESARALPPPDELRALPLDVLINILTSARPLADIIRDKFNGKKSKDLLPTPEISMDPHRRVDTSRFLLQRTRRVSWALTALRKRLEVPVATESSLEWRLHGPVGVQALIDALIREAHSDDEKAFLLCELALELWRVKPTTQPGYLPSTRVRDEIRKILAEIQKSALENLNGSAKNLRAYIEQVFEAVKK